jgi:hypothetical protein
VEDFSPSTIEEVMKAEGGEEAEAGGWRPTAETITRGEAQGRRRLRGSLDRPNARRVNVRPTQLTPT